MDVLNFISWLKSKRQVTTVNASQTLIPLGLKDARRSDGYLPGAISVDDLLALSPGLPSFVEYDETNKTLWNSGTNSNSLNTSFGKDALTGNPGGHCTAIGERALAIGAGSFNTAIGGYAISNLINSDHNTSVGAFALAGDLTGSYNTALGSTVLASTTLGEGNTGIGYGVLMLNTTGDTNVAVGYRAMLNNTTGYRNVGIGSGSLLNNTTGAQNVAIGQSALGNNTTGTDNVGIGYATDSGNFNGSVLLGKAATATGNNQLVIGSSTNNVGAIATEALVPTESWAVRINGVNYKIPLQIA
jgi:hypothetical protein